MSEHLVEYCAYLKREISTLKCQLAEALRRQHLYEPLLQQYEEEVMELPTKIEPTQSYWQWFTQRFSSSKHV